LRRLLANNIDKAAQPGQAVYTCMLNEAGGVVDDLIAYWLGGDRYRLVVNAATRDKDLAWMRAQLNGDDVVLSERPEVAMIAVQGPEARALASSALPEGLREATQSIRPFFAVGEPGWLVARTGYTGEDGWEIMLPDDQAAAFWGALSEAGVQPCGLGARDTLRLEAGLNLYGTDMDESTLPDASNLAWTIALDEGRDFVGRESVEAARANGVAHKLVGLLLEGRGVLRNHQRLLDESGTEIGEITSGGFSPTLERSVALARVISSTGDRALVDIRGKSLPVRVVKPPFVRRGKILIDV
jgi:aminomethyltransferase